MYVDYLSDESRIRGVETPAQHCAERQGSDRKQLSDDVERTTEGDCRPQLCKASIICVIPGVPQKVYSSILGSIQK